MQGFLKGAILGLILAVVIFVTAAVLAPPVDPSKYSEAPKNVSEQEIALASPDDAEVPDRTTTAAARDEEEGGEAVALQPLQRPQAGVPEEDGVVRPERPNDVTVATDSPAALVVPPLAQTPEAAETADTVELPQSVQIAEAAPDEAPEVSTQPDEPPTAEAADLPQIIPPASDDATDEAAEEDRRSVRIDARENPNLRKPVTEPSEEEVPRVQSEAEAENAPPNALVRSPEAPRAIGKRVTTFGDRAATVLTNRLPSIGRESDADVGSALQNPLKPNALRDHAQGFNDAGLPIVSLILLDTGEASDTLAEYIGALNMAVSVAIDPLSEGSTERAMAYHDAGAEILVLADFPTGATAQDVEVNVGRGLSLLQNSVALMPKPGGMLPPRTSLSQITAIASATGHGIVAQKQGLNSIGQLADRAGVPNVTIQRIVEPQTTPESLRAQMNRAIFRASQDGGAVVLAHADAATLQALLAWGVADRPASVSMAPVSAVLGAGIAR